MDTQFLKETLDNGLTIFFKEIHSAPIISSWIWYRVGSRVEKYGFTGISHWVEHMQFKGTQKLSGPQMDRIIAREGGVGNAFTHLDWTTYYETLPANKIEIAFQLESDRMLNSVFDPIEVESERTVILSEKEGKDNDPFSRLNNQVTQSSFIRHPYKNEIIGTEDDLKNIQRDDLFNHYRNYYQPSNAVLTIAGDFNTKSILNLVKHSFGSIPNIKKVHNHSAKPESTISKKKEIILNGPGDTIYLQIAYRAPAANDSDFFAFTILDSILTGPASLNMFGGGGTSNKISRLYQRLVEKELAISVFGGLQATIDPFIYDLAVILHPERKPDQVLTQIDGEIDKLCNQHVSHKEISRAIKQATALFVYGLENITNQAFWLGYSEMFANYDWFTNYINHLKNIQPVDILRVAQKYLGADHRVIGLYIPDQIQGDGL